MQTVTITSVPGARYQYQLSARGHTIISDAPATLKGGDTGPTPHELFLQALGTCAAMTMQMYADRKNIPVTKISVEVTEDEIVDPDDAAQKIPHIVQVFTVEGTNLTDAQLADLKRVAGLCPVKKLVVGKKAVDSTVNRA